MSTQPAPPPAAGAIVSVILDSTITDALDAVCGETLSSRAGFVRRVLAEALRGSGHLPPLPSSPRPMGRHRPNATLGQRR